MYQQGSELTLAHPPASIDYNSHAGWNEFHRVIYIVALPEVYA